MNRFPKLYIAGLVFIFLVSALTLWSRETHCVRLLVFDKGEYGSRFYRIPAITVTSDGTLIAVADRRNESLKDLPGKIDVVCRRSIDGGRTWSGQIIVAQADSLGGYGDPAIGVDPKSGDVICVMTHGNGVWEATGNDDNPHIMVSRSSDNGSTWSRPIDITETLYSDLTKHGTAPISAFATSGALCSTSDGRLFFTLVVRDDIKKWSKLKTFVCESKDGGHSWHVVSAAVDTDGDESKIVELTDGKLLMSIRNRRKGARKFSRGDKSGRQWTAPEYCSGMVEPGCNGDIIRITDSKRSRLIQTLPADSSERKNVALFASDDDGDTWKKLKVLCPAPSAYSALVALPDGSLGCLIEEGASDGGWRIWYQTINREDIWR